jgi:hypothetical protein
VARILTAVKHLLKILAVEKRVENEAGFWISKYIDIL